MLKLKKEKRVDIEKAQKVLMDAGFHVIERINIDSSCVQTHVVGSKDPVMKFRFESKIEFVIPEDFFEEHKC